MVKFSNLLSRLNPAKILVIGDMLLDTYTIGKARRISPEAPVAIVNVQHQEHHPGGAGNVILNLLSLKAEVVAIGRIGKDGAGQILTDALKNAGVDISMLVAQEAYWTPVKNRVIAENQQIVRIDHEQVIPLNESLEQHIIEHLPLVLQGVKVVAISDYGKGFLTGTLLTAIIEQAVKEGILVITDPKGHDFTKYKGTSIIKPNLSEAYAAANLPLHASLESVASRVLEQTQAQLLMITRSEAGISLFDALGRRYDFPVHVKEVKDVTGAGDTVLAMLAYAVANQLSYEEAAYLCNVAAGIVIEHIGCAQVTLLDLAHTLFKRDLSQKVFDQEHLFVLQVLLSHKPFNLLILSQMDQITHPLFQALKEFAKTEEMLLVYVNEAEPSEIFIEMLASLREVDFILLQLDCLKDFCQQVVPLGIYHFDSLQGQLMSLESIASEVNGRIHEYQCPFSMAVPTKS